MKPRYFNYFHIHCKGINLLARRNAKDIWQNLYEYPLIETDEAVDFGDLERTGDYSRWMDGVDEIHVLRMMKMPKHLLSHRIIYASFYELEISNFSEGMKDYLQVRDGELEKYAVSRLIELYRER